MKQFASPFIVNATGVTKAYLVGNPCGTEVTYDLTVTNNDGATATLSTTETIPSGVWRLKIVSDCGCHSMLVYSPPCKVTAGDGNYDGDGGSPDPIPSCDNTRCPYPEIGCFVLGDFCPDPVIGAFIKGAVLCPDPGIGAYVA